MTDTRKNQAPQEDQEHPEWQHVKAKAMQYFGIDLIPPNFKHCRDLIRSVEYDSKGVKRSRQAIRKLIRERK